MASKKNSSSFYDVVFSNIMKCVDTPAEGCVRIYNYVAIWRDFGWKDFDVLHRDPYTGRYSGGSSEFNPLTVEDLIENLKASKNRAISEMSATGEESLKKLTSFFEIFDVAIRFMEPYASESLYEEDEEDEEDCGF